MGDRPLSESAPPFGDKKMQGKGRRTWCHLQACTLRDLQLQLSFLIARAPFAKVRSLGRRSDLGMTAVDGRSRHSKRARPVRAPMSRPPQAVSSDVAANILRFARQLRRANAST